MTNRRSTEAGFTLIEMLVALSVFAIASLALLRLDSYAVGATADLDARGMAQLVAQNETALLLTDTSPIVRGTTSKAVTNGGRSFSVRTTITPTADQRLLRVDLLVAESGSGGRSAITFVKRVA